MSAAVGGRISSTKIKMAFSGDSLIRFLQVRLKSVCFSSPDDIDELSNSKVCRDEVLLLVDCGDVALLYLLADYLVSVEMEVGGSLGSGQSTSGGYARPRPCACLRQMAEHGGESRGRVDWGWRLIMVGC